MYTSKKSSQDKKKLGADRTLSMIAPVLASLLLTSCLATDDGRSERLSLALNDTSRGIGDGDQSTSSGSASAFETAGSFANAGGQLGRDAYGAESRRVALVIGNSAYTSDIGRLANPRRDAAAIAGALERTGFEVSLLQDVSREEMRRAVLAFDNKLRDTDVGLFYYAGHAVQVNGRNFMIPVEANLNISTSRKDAVADYVALETVEIDDVLARMGNAEADLNIVILDACRNNPFSSGTRGLNRGLAQTSAPRGTFVAYATAPGKVAQDGASLNSPYTAAIVKNLETPGLKLEDVFKRVRQDVATETNGEQIPWENSSVFGDFYFTGPPTDVAALSTTEPEPEKRPQPELSREDYVEIQKLLSRIGHYRGPITGEADDRTRNAIIQWQKQHGLELDGEISKVQIAFMRTDANRADGKVNAAKPSDNGGFKALSPLQPRPAEEASPGETKEASDNLGFDGEFKSLPPLRPRQKDEKPTREVIEPPVENKRIMIIPPPPA